MTTKELIYKVHLLLNKNNENANINIEAGNIILLYNRESLRFIQDYIERNNSSDNIQNLQSLVVDDLKLDVLKTSKDKIEYKLPDDFLFVINGKNYSDYKSGECSLSYTNRIVKNNDLNSVINSSFLKPSFKWRRSVGTILNNKFIVYKENDVEIKNTYFSYYKKPNEIDIEGYIKLDGTSSKTIDPDISDYIVEMILDRVVLEIQREFVQEYQIAATRERAL